jgi:hypothetical protein
VSVATYQHKCSVHTQTEVERPELLVLSLLFDCLACNVCHGAARAIGSEERERIIDSMDMIKGRRGTIREGVDGVWN